MGFSGFQATSEHRRRLAGSWPDDASARPRRLPEPLCLYSSTASETGIDTDARTDLCLPGVSRRRRWPPKRKGGGRQPTCVWHVCYLGGCTRQLRLKACRPLGTTRCRRAWRPARRLAELYVPKHIGSRRHACGSGTSKRDRRSRGSPHSGIARSSGAVAPWFGRAQLRRKSPSTNARCCCQWKQRRAFMESRGGWNTQQSTTEQDASSSV